MHESNSHTQTDGRTDGQTSKQTVKRNQSKTEHQAFKFQTVFLIFAQKGHLCTEHWRHDIPRQSVCFQTKQNKRSFTISLFNTATV